MTGKFMTDPVRILVKRDELTLEVSFFLSQFVRGNVITTGFYSVSFSICRASNNSLLLLRERSGSLIHCVICMTPSLSPKLLFSATPRER